MSERSYLGSCLCGGVKYEVSTEVEVVSHCHCSMCRKAHGAAFATYGSVRKGMHRFTEGSELLREYRSSPSVIRTFCSVCGAPLLWHYEDRSANWVSFPLGSLDTEYVAYSHKHIHVDSKAPWYENEDRWPQAEEY